MSVNVNPSSWRLRTAGGIPYCLMEGYPKGSFGEDDAEVQEQYLIQAEDLYDFVVESLSDTDVYPGGIWYYRKPRPYPGLSFLLTRKVDVEPFDSSRPADPFGIDSSAPDKTYGEFVKVTISYGNVDASDPEQQDNNLLDISCNASGELLQYPPRGNARLEDPSIGYGSTKPVKDLVYPYVKNVPMLEWSVKFRRILASRLSVSLNTARGMLGKVNSAAVPLLYVTDAEVLLFAGFSLQFARSWRSVDRFGTADLKFVEKRVVEDGSVKGHNHFFDPSTHRWLRLILNGSRYAYESANLNTLFY